MQPRKLLRRASPKAGKKGALLANNVTREFGLFFGNSAGLVDISAVQGLTTRTRPSFVQDFESYESFLDVFDRIIAEKQKNPPTPQEWFLFVANPANQHQNH